MAELLGFREMTYKVLDLFSGIGGFSLGLERTGGFETVAFCEIEKFPQKVLAKHWPGAPIHNDITNLKYRQDVDMVTAGFPCPDISYAGQGAGLSGSRSGLFWYILRTACMVGRPKLLLENVAALLNRGLSTVLGALASFGYDAEWHCIPASHVGANHRRDRCWILADSNREGLQGFRGPILSERSFAEGHPGSGHRWMPTPRVCRGGDGVQNRSHRLKGLGNSVVPQIPELIGRAILEAEK